MDNHEVIDTVLLNHDTKSRKTNDFWTRIGLKPHLGPSLALFDPFSPFIGGYHHTKINDRKYENFALQTDGHTERQTDRQGCLQRIAGPVNEAVLKVCSRLVSILPTLWVNNILKL